MQYRDYDFGQKNIYHDVLKVKKSKNTIQSISFEYKARGILAIRIKNATIKNCYLGLLRCDKSILIAS